MKRIFTTLALIFATLFANAQFVNITTDNGLINNSTKCFVKGNDGSLWIGTNDGLSRKLPNGTFTGYTVSNGLINNEVTCLSIDNYGKIWVGTPYGISIYDGSTWEMHSFGSVSNNKIIDIKVRNNGDIWLATENEGIWVYNGFTYYKLSTTNGLSSNTITCLEEYNDTMWVGTYNSGLCKYIEPGFAIFDTTNGIEGMRITSILSTQDGLYFYSWGKLHFFNGINFTISNYNEYQIGTGPAYKLQKGNNEKIFLLFNSGICEINNFNIVHKYTKYNTNLINEYPTIYSVLSNIYYTDSTIYISTIDNGYYYSKDFENNIYNDTIDINNIKALINPNGVLFSKSYHPYSVFEVPIGSGNNSNVSSTIWLGGIDDDNNFHIAGALSNDYRDWDVGPISNNYSTEDYHNTYDRVWKVNKSEIDEHIANWNTAGYIMPEVIANWPDIADYEDVNLNGIYDPENGDYPKIRGDQAILSIFNDDIRRDFIPNRNKMKVEIHCLVYAYNSTDSALNNTIFANYKIINKSNYNYKSVYMSVLDDIQIGMGGGGMYLGTDTSRNSFFGYTSTNIDTGAYYNHGYGIGNIPAQSVTFLNTKMTSTSYFGYHDGTFTSPPEMEFPETPMEYYNYLMGKWKDGTDMTFGGCALGGTIPVNYVYTGDPSVPTGWNELDEGNNAGSRTGLGVIGPLDLNTGQELCIDVAYINAIAWNYTNLHSVKKLKSRIEQIQNWYSNQNFTCDSIITQPLSSFNVFANDTTFCSNYLTYINLETVVVGGNSPYTYQWENETGTFFSNNENPMVMIPTNTLDYYVTVTDNFGNTAVDTLILSVIPPPNINLGNDTIICVGNTIQFTLPLNYNYVWNTGTTTNILTASETGQYVVTATNSGCLDIDNIHIEVISPEINLTEITPACINAALQLSVDNYPNILWNTGETTQTININTSALGQTYYYVTVTDTNGCISNDSTLVVVNDLPNLFLGNDTTIDELWSLLLNAYVGPAGYYTWSDGSHSSTYLFNGSIGEGNYNVSVNVTDINGCANSDVINITVIAGLIVDETGNYNIVIYPNPSDAEFNIKLPDNKIYKYKIIDTKGKIIKTGEFNNTINKININEVNKGTYFLIIDELNLTKKLILR